MNDEFHAEFLAAPSPEYREIRRLAKEYGAPHIIKGRFIGSRYWDGSTSRKQGNHSEQEFVYLQEKWPELADHAATT